MNALICMNAHLYLLEYFIVLKKMNEKSSLRLHPVTLKKNLKHTRRQKFHPNFIGQRNNLKSDTKYLYLL